MIDLGGITQEEIVLQQQAEAPAPEGDPVGTVANVRRRLAQAAAAAPAPAGDVLGAPAPGPDSAPAGGAGYCSNKPVASRIIGFIFDSASRYKLKPVLKDSSSIPKSVSWQCPWEAGKCHPHRGQARAAGGARRAGDCGTAGMTGGVSALAAATGSNSRAELPGLPTVASGLQSWAPGAAMPAAAGMQRRTDTARMPVPLPATLCSPGLAARLPLRFTAVLRSLCPSPCAPLSCALQVEQIPLFVSGGFLAACLIVFVSMYISGTLEAASA